MPEGRQKSAEELAREIEQETTEHIKLLSLSEGKHITVVLGNTGSGKSTFLNWLAGKKLIVGKGNKILLEDESDVTAMKIGNTCESMTKYPVSIEIGEFLFFDLPGFRDSGGVECDLINAVFIKAILEGAKSVRVIFIVSEDEVGANRGELFKKLLKGMEKMFDGENRIIMDSSFLVITKSTQENISSLSEFLEESVPKEYHPYLMNWSGRGALFQVKKPMDKQICHSGKTDILRALSCPGQKITHVNIGALYPNDVDAELNMIFNVILDKEFNSFIPNPDVSKLSSLLSAIAVVKGESKTEDGEFKEFWDNFNEYLKSINALNVLKPLSESTYNTVFGIFQRNKSYVLRSSIKQWESQSSVLLTRLENVFLSRIQVVCEQTRNQRMHYSCDDVNDVESGERKLGCLNEALHVDMRSIFMEAIEGDPELHSIAEQHPNGKKFFDEQVRDYCEQNLGRLIGNIEGELRQNIEFVEERISRFKSERRAEEEKKRREQQDYWNAVELGVNIGNYVASLFTGRPPIPFWFGMNK